MTSSSPDSLIHRYHDGTKHYFTHFARSLGYLDWASQPRPFRSFTGAREFPLYPAPGAPRGAYVPRHTTFGELFTPTYDHPQGRTRDSTFDRREQADTGLSRARLQPEAPSAGAIGDLLRHALGLSAWKELGGARWSLRVNPSSGNLHPTEAYVVCGGLTGLADGPAVYHYAADRHALELRALLLERAWAEWCGPHGPVLIALTSIHWRESWKYGERAFRYCQHDLGHAIAAVTLAAAMLGWRAALLPAWSHRDIAALTGVDRDGDFVEAEREEPGCVLALTAATPDVPADVAMGGESLALAARTATWSGQANQLSEDHVQWTFIDEIARGTEDPGRIVALPASVRETFSTDTAHEHDARMVMLQRRSAVAFDAVSRIEATEFFAMLSQVMPGAHSPWSAMWWTPRIHLLLFVHRVNGLAPGVYLLARDAQSGARLNAARRRDLLSEPAHESLPLVRLTRGDCRVTVRRLSCDQDIASDGFFSLGMIADFDASLTEHGPSFYRHLFWESGVIGQVLYLHAEAVGARATGIGCFYDDAVHDVLGLEGHAFQSLYHFTVGAPVNDRRLTTTPGYCWEQ